ncbi:MAG: TraB/GumN family protein [archaeon]
MLIYKNVTLIGTSHISIESIKEIKSFITENKPDIIALELDEKRYYSLLHKVKPKLKDIFQMGIGPFLITIIGAYAEKKLGEIVHVSPGSEMKSAIRLAKKYKLKIELIDQDINITLKRLLKELTFKEKLRFLYDIVTGIFKRPKINFDLRTVPSKEIIKELISKVKKDYPSVYKTLIYERNIVMAKNLNKIIHLNPDKKILAIIGAGHEEDIFELIKGSKNITFSSYSSNLNIRIQ